MSIELGKLQLSKIHRIKTLETANLVYQRVPGMEGGAAQDLGRASVRLQIDGIFYGLKRKEEIEQLRKLYLKRKPIDFIADLVSQSYVSQVILESFEEAEYPEQFSYSLIISEYIKPSKNASKTTSKKTTTATKTSSSTNKIGTTLVASSTSNTLSKAHIDPSSPAIKMVDTNIKIEAQSMLDVITLSDALNLGSFPAITNPFVPLQDSLSGMKETLSELTASLRTLQNTLGD